MIFLLAHTKVSITSSFGVRLCNRTNLRELA